MTDMDETLTYQGRLAARTYTALERLQTAGIRVIPVTAAPAGWCDQMARMWPVDGVIGENGALFFSRSADTHRLRRDYWHQGEAVEDSLRKRELLIEMVTQQLPWARLAADQGFRQASVAWEIPSEIDRRDSLIEIFRTVGAEYTFNNLWALAWFGRYDKLVMAKHVLSAIYGLLPGEDVAQVFYSGDSLNDGPMFGYFRHTLGVSTIRDCVEQMSDLPAWISEGAGGSGFVEAVDVILACQTRR
nr:HAD hydrolase family protein [Pseudomonas sp. K5002]